jgi:tetratricopeptide (TPR) repeat protein
LCRGYSHIGYQTLLADRPADALPLLQQAAEISEELAALDPDRIEFWELRIRSYERLGHAHHWIRHVDLSRAAYRRLHELASAWVAVDPASSRANHALAWSYIKLGDVEGLAGDVARSRAHFDQAIALGRKRVAADPGDEPNTLALQAALNNLAKLEGDHHELARARALQQEASALLIGMAEADPEDIEKQIRAIVDSYNRIVIERDGGHYSEAAELVRATLDRLSRLKREGRLEGQPRYGVELIDELTDELAYCEAAPHAIADLEFARSRRSARIRRGPRPRGRPAGRHRRAFGGRLRGRARARLIPFPGRSPRIRQSRSRAGLA